MIWDCAFSKFVVTPAWRRLWSKTKRCKILAALRIFGAMTTLRSNLRHWRLVSLACFLLSIQHFTFVVVSAVSQQVSARLASRTSLAAENDLFGQVAELFEGPAFEEGEQWRALTRIKVRKEPSINSPQLEDKVIEKGETFFVAEVRRAKIPTGDKHRLYLRLAASKGWVFDLGVAGDWYGKYIAEKVYEDEKDEGSNPLGGIGDAMGNVFR